MDKWPPFFAGGKDVIARLQTDRLNYYIRSEEKVKGFLLDFP